MIAMAPERTARVLEDLMDLTGGRRAFHPLEHTMAGRRRAH
jgi:hypothetical protein